MDLTERRRLRGFTGGDSGVGDGEGEGGGSGSEDDGGGGGVVLGQVLMIRCICVC